MVSSRQSKKRTNYVVLAEPPEAAFGIAQPHLEDSAVSTEEALPRLSLGRSGQCPQVHLLRLSSAISQSRSNRTAATIPPTYGAKIVDNFMLQSILQ